MTLPLAEGSRLGRYRLLTELGRGGMASVWVALEQTPAGAQRFVALKIMLPRLATQSTFRAMFLDEGQLVRSIEHRNVVRVFEVGEDHGMLFMAMEWVEGDSLHQLIRAARKRRAIPPEMAVRIIADAAGGLHEAHELRGWDGELRGVVHCDVSPQNILIGVDGAPKLVDFGVAHAAALSDDERPEVRGKLGYMSPEQALARPLDRRSDIFSLGIVLFELTTGKRLFGRQDPQQTLALVRAARVPVPSSVWPGYPQVLGAIVLKALQRDPRHRYQTALDFKQALEQFLVETRTMVSNAGVASLLSRVLGDRIRERRALVQVALDAQKQTIALPGQELANYEVTSDIAAEGPSDTGLFEVDTASVSVIAARANGSLSQRSVAPHVVETPHPIQSSRRTSWIVGGVVGLGILTTVLAVRWASSGVPPEEPAGGRSPSRNAAGVSQEKDRDSRKRSDEDTVSLESIPVAPDESGSRPRAAGRPPWTRAVPRTEAGSASGTAPAPRASTKQPVSGPESFGNRAPDGKPKGGEDIGIDNPYL